MIVNNEPDLLAMLEAKDREQAKRHVYKYTDCGAWIDFRDWGCRIGSIVEGCDFGTAIYVLRYPFTAEDYDARIKAIEREANHLWVWANEGGAEGNAPDTSFEYEHFEQDGRSS